MTEVQARNPSLQAASAAWPAAAAHYSQAILLDDPMFTSMVGPRGVGTDNGGGWMVEASQKLPWAGKRACEAMRPRPTPMPCKETSATSVCGCRRRRG